MKISKSIKYIVLILLIQYFFIIFIPVCLFHIYSSITLFPGSVLMDQLLKAIISFISVAIWIYQWMWVTNKTYHLLRRD